MSVDAARKSRVRAPRVAFNGVEFPGGDKRIQFDSSTTSSAYSDA
jgi:hypothetical protein